MDRRRFLAQSLVASSACAMPFSLFAQGNLAGYISLRSGKISTKELKLALKEAIAQGKGLLLHPRSSVVLDEALEITTSFVGSGANVHIKNGAHLLFRNNSNKTQVITGVEFEGSVYFEDSFHQIVENNTFLSSEGPAVTVKNVTNFQFKNNNVEAHFGHGLSLYHDFDSKISNNMITLFGPGHYLCFERTCKASVLNNKFKNKSSDQRPSLVVKNDDGLNPQITIKNNNLV